MREELTSVSNTPYKTKNKFKTTNFLPFDFKKEELITLDQYMAVRNGLDKNFKTRPGISNAEGKIFGFEANKKGWYKKNVNNQIQLGKVRSAVRRVLGTPWVDIATKKRLSEAFIDQDEFDPKYVYLIHSQAKISKIGISKDPVRRACDLQTGHGLPLKVICYWAVKNNPYEVEKFLHKAFSEKQMEGEWFRGLLTPEEISNKMPGIFEKFTPLPKDK